MAKTQLAYFEKEDILHLAITDEPEHASVEVSPNITAELNDNGELIGLEILNATAFIRDSILESVQAKMLQLALPKAARVVSPQLAHPLKAGQSA
ncbi:MAG: DUF2283 domain-containing protein [Ardenticatenaceae bacterium]